MLDYLSFIIFKLIGPVIRVLPLGVSLSLGKFIGTVLYYFDCRHRRLSYCNLRTAFAQELPPQELSRIIKSFYKKLGQNLIEIFLLPKVDKAYLEKYVRMDGKENIIEAFKKGKGVILLGMHAGSWELSNLVCANFGFPFNLFVRSQRLPLLDSLLNKYRQQKGCKILQRQNQTRSLIEALKNNESIGMTADQGGKNGILVKFFGKEASMPVGAIKLALKLGSVILPAYYTRIQGPYQKIIIEPPFELKNSGDEETDIKENLQRLVFCFEKLIRRYPDEYFWQYKIWKYAKERNILILSDGKAGHLKQSEAAASVLKNVLAQKGIKSNIDISEANFKDKISRQILTLKVFLLAKFSCRKNMDYLKQALVPEDYKTLSAAKPDFIVSSGSSLAPVNYLLSRESLAKSIVIMRPSILGSSRFNLVVMPRHDLPSARKNIVVTEGALNLVNKEYLDEQADKLAISASLDREGTGFSIGILIGGDTKEFSLEEEEIKEVIKQIKIFSEVNKSPILATTSRRTPVEVENLMKKEFSGYRACKLLVIANEDSPPYAIGGILGLSKVIVTSAESISMISEAVNSGKRVVVFKACRLDKKHERFLNNFSKNKYITIVKPQGLAAALEQIKNGSTEQHILRDNNIVAEAIRNIL